MDETSRQRQEILESRQHERQPDAKPRIYRQRVAAARRRIRVVMARRLVVYSRELERQVCEVGFNFATAPPSQRPQPVHFSAALNELLTPAPDNDDPESLTVPELYSDDIEVLPQRHAKFYSYAYVPREDRLGVLDRKVAAVRSYLRVEYQPPLSGWHAESIHHAALVASPGWFSVGWKGGSAISRLHDRELSAGTVDMAGVHMPTGVRFAAEVKNRREWFYETDEAVWGLLGAAVELDAVPVLIARRVPEPTFLLMKAVGGIAFQAMKLILPPEVRDMHEPGEPTFDEAVTLLGFHTDIDYLNPAEPHPRHFALWRRVLPPQIEEKIARFRLVSEAVRRVAFGEGMRSRRLYGKVSRRSRHRVVYDFLAEIAPLTAKSPDEELTPEEVPDPEAQ